MPGVYIIDIAPLTVPLERILERRHEIERMLPSLLEKYDMCRYYVITSTPVSLAIYVADPDADHLEEVILDFKEELVRRLGLSDFDAELSVGAPERTPPCALCRLCFRVTEADLIERVYGQVRSQFRNVDVADEIVEKICQDLRESPLRTTEEEFFIIITIAVLKILDRRGELERLRGRHVASIYNAIWDAFFKRISREELIEVLEEIFRKCERIERPQVIRKWIMKLRRYFEREWREEEES